MSDEETLVAEAVRAQAPLDSRPAEKKLEWFEVSLVVLVAFSNSFIGSIALLFGGRNAAGPNSNARWLGASIHELLCLALLGYVLSRRRLRFRDLGLNWSLGGVWRGFVVAAVAYGFAMIGGYILHQLHNILHSFSSGGVTAFEAFGSPTALFISFSFLNPFFEELIVRAYLMSEIRSLTGSWSLAVIVSVAVQTSYHLYYGVEQALGLGFLFLVFAIYYARTRKALPIIVAHGIFDLLALVPLLQAAHRAALSH